MGIKIVREPSETPNINNIDDFVPFRYAYGNQDGYVIGKGNEVNIEQVDTKSVLIKSGRFVVQGVEVDINANGEAVDFDDVPQNSDVFVTVYAEVNLDTNSVNIQKVFDTVDYPAVDKGDDLTHTTNGTANIEIGNIKLSNGSIVEVNKKIKPIEYNLGITKDTNGVLRIGDVIIPQKKLLWSGSVAINKKNTYVQIAYGKFSGKNIEIVVQDAVGSRKYYKLMLQIGLEQKFNEYVRFPSITDIDTIIIYFQTQIERNTGAEYISGNSKRIVHEEGENVTDDVTNPLREVVAIYEIIE